MPGHSFGYGVTILIILADHAGEINVTLLAIFKKKDVFITSCKRVFQSRKGAVVLACNYIISACAYEFRQVQIQSGDS